MTPIIDKLKNKFNFKYIHLELQNNDHFIIDTISDEYPQYLHNLINWSPNIIVFNNELWNKDKLDKQYSLLDISIFNGYIENGIAIYNHQINHNESNLYSWCELKLQYHINRSYHKDIKFPIQEIYQSFTLSPFWIKSKSGLFTPETPKSIINLYGNTFYKKFLQKLTNIKEYKDIFEYYRSLELTSYWSFDKSFNEHKNFIFRYIELLMDYYVI